MIDPGKSLWIREDDAQTQPIVQFSNHDNTVEMVNLSAAGHLGLGARADEPNSILTIERNSTTDPIADAWTIHRS